MIGCQAGAVAVKERLLYRGGAQTIENRQGHTVFQRVCGLAEPLGH